MTYSKTVPYSGGGTLYAKPVTDGSLPSSTPTWATDVVATASSNSSGVTFTGLTDGQSYWVFEQAGGSPASTDLVYATFSDSGDISSSVSSALSAIHLDKLLASAYTPENKPGNADSIFNQLIESDVSPLQLNTAALSNVAPVINADATQTTARANAASAASQTTASAIRTSVGLESANLSHLVNAVIGKNVVTNNGNGTFDIAVRNAADDATLVTVRYNPTTGTKTVL